MKKLLILICIVTAMLLLASCDAIDGIVDSIMGEITGNQSGDGETVDPDDGKPEDEEPVEPAPETPENPNPEAPGMDVDDGGTSSEEPDEPSPEEPEYLYKSFTASEKAIFEQYIGALIPFVPNNEYYVEGYYDVADYENGINFYTVGNTSAEFTAYLAMFADYELYETYEDEYGDTWYCYTKDDVVVDLSYYQDIDGNCYIDVFVYSDLSSDIEDDPTDPSDPIDPDIPSGTAKLSYSMGDVFGATIFTDKTVTTSDGKITFELVTDHCASNADGTYRVYFGKFGIISSTVDVYGIELVARGKDNKALTATISVSNNGTAWTEVKAIDISGGFTTYSASFGSGYKYIKIAAIGKQLQISDIAFLTSGTGSGTGSGNQGGSTNLPDGTDGVYNVDFTDATNVKDVTDQGYYIDGCPTVGSPGVLVIPVDFRDITAASRGYSIDAIKNAFLEGGKTDYYSVYDYYYTSSYGKLDLDITVLGEWFRPKYTSTYYAAQTMDYDGDDVMIGDQLILNEALAYLEDKMDLSVFDSDSNNIIDAVVLVTTLDIDSETDFYWAYRYWNIYTDEDGYYYEYDGVSANDYLWAPYQFLYETYDENDDVSYTNKDGMNTYTFIHEFGHVLGADDYYDTAYVGSPMDGCDMMDGMMGDHNAFTKFNYGWLTESRLVVTDTSVTLTLNDFSKNGDTIIIANNWDPTLGAYQEYYVVVYYTNTGLNAEPGGYFTRDGIVVYHVNAALYSEEYEGEIYYDIYNNNTDPSSDYGTENNLIELVKSNLGNYTFVSGDRLPSLTDDQGKSLLYTFTVDSITDGVATLTFTKK